MELELASALTDLQTSVKKLVYCLLAIGGVVVIAVAILRRNS